jgi:hypothetical protein
MATQIPTLTRDQVTVRRMFCFTGESDRGEGIRYGDGGNCSDYYDGVRPKDYRDGSDVIYDGDRQDVGNCFDPCC